MNTIRQALIALLLAATLAVSGCGRTTPHTTPSATTTTSTPNPATEEADHDDGPGPAVSVSPPPAALNAATAYVRAWARPQLDRDTWYAGTRHLVTPAYAQLLADTDPANVPAQAVTGAARAVSSTTAVVVADVPTDTGTVRVRLTPSDDRWLVATCAPAQETR
jgi:hypothetical protein